MVPGGAAGSGDSLLDPAAPTIRPDRPRSWSRSRRRAPTAAPRSATAHRVRNRPERGRDGGLVAGSHHQQRGHRPEHPGLVVGIREQRTRAVSLGQAELERLLARGQRGAFPLGQLRLLAGLAQPRLDVHQVRRRGVVRRVETALAGVEARDLVLQHGEVGLRALGPLVSAAPSGRQSRDLVVRRGGPAAQRVLPAVHPGPALAPVGGLPYEAGHPVVLLGVSQLGRLPGLDRAGERAAQLRHLGRDGCLLVAHPRRFGGERVRLLVGSHRFGGALGVLGGPPKPFASQFRGARDPVPHSGQAIPGLLRASRRRRVLGELPGQARLVLAGGEDRGLDVSAPGPAGRLVGELPLERRTGADQVVGEQPRPGVAEVGLDSGRPPCHVGLLAQRLQLAADLTEQVLDPGQVRLGRVQPAQRLLLALAVLEYACGLFDEPAAILGSRLEDRVELALPDHDVHLPPDARIAQQVLHIEQPARLPVDRVLRTAGTKHGPGDGDLGILHRQRAVGIVDREHDLSASQRCPAGRPGEDHVLHLPTAQRLGALLAHHPGQRVDDVGLPRPVGSDDAGDAGFELERRAGREGLEPAQCQALEVQTRLLVGSPTRGRGGTVAGSLASGSTSAGQPRRAVGRGSGGSQATLSAARAPAAARWTARW